MNLSEQLRSEQKRTLINLFGKFGKIFTDKLRSTDRVEHHIWTRRFYSNCAETILNTSSMANSSRRIAWGGSGGSDDPPHSTEKSPQNCVLDYCQQRVNFKKFVKN